MEGQDVTKPDFTGTGTAEDPWVLYTPSLGSQILMHKDEDRDPPILVCAVGKTILNYDLRIIEDLHQMLKDRGDWVELGNADEQKPAKDGTVEAWARSTDNPIGGWYGQTQPLRATGLPRPSQGLDLVVSHLRSFADRLNVGSGCRFSRVGGWSA
jgi:hypothetical protein